MKLRQHLFWALLPLLLTGCFEHREAPPRLVEAIGLEAAVALQPQVQRLVLNGESLGTLPPLLAELPQLEELLLRGAKIDTFDGLAALQRLRVLDLSATGLQSLPAELPQLATLEHLYLVDNALTNLPSTVAGCKQLTYLNLDRNRLQALPAELATLTSLRWLRLNGNRLTALPEAIGELHNLQRLYLRDNRLEALPASLAECCELEDLALSGNLLKEFPLAVTRLPKLRNLDLRGNPLTGELPLEAIAEMKALRLLTLTGCGIPLEREAALRRVLPHCLITL